MKKDLLLSTLYTLLEIIILRINILHKIKVVYLLMFLYNMFIILSQLTHSIVMHLQAQTH